MTTQITLPEMGEGVIEGTLARWLVREGDRVERYAPIAEVETDCLLYTSPSPRD